MNILFQNPTGDTLRRLFKVTKAFRLLEPWKWMTNEDVVAVRDPTSDRIAYCVVLLNGFDALLGDQGLVKCLEIVTNRVSPIPGDFLYNMDSLGLLLTIKQELKPEDMVICKSMGLNEPWDGLWPQFRRLEPGYVPWYLENDDAEFLAVCLEQVIEIAERAIAKPTILGPRDSRTFLARIPKKNKDRIVWREEFISPVPLKRVIVIKPKVDWENLKKVFVPAKGTNEIWEADCFLENPPLNDPKGRPRFPFCYLLVNASIGNLYHVSVMQGNDLGADFLNKITLAVRRFGVYPRAIHIRKQHLKAVFEPLAVYGIATSVVKDLPALDNARNTISMVVENFVKEHSLKKPKIKETKIEKTEKFPVYKPRRIYEFKVSILRIRPAIWREIQVESNITLKMFAQIIIGVMGWENTHLHMFYIGGRQFSLPGAGNVGNFENESKFCLHDFPLKELMKLVFIYDFGDEWEHIVTLEDTLMPQIGIKYPRCLKGARNCPPEDCGGPVGYIEFLNAIISPMHPEYEQMVESYGGKFKPERFNLNLANKKLKEIASQESSLLND